MRGHSRADEHVAVLDEIAELVAERVVDVVVVTGDLFDSATPSPESERIVYSALQRFVGDGARVVAIGGNHDNPRRLDAISSMAAAAGVDIIARPVRPDDGGVRRIDVGGEELRLACLPFVSQRAALGISELMDLAADQLNQRYATLVSRIVEQLAAGFGTDTVNVFCAHLMVDGATMGGGERSAHTVFEYSVPAQAFPSVAHYVALGHLHRPQRIPAAAPTRYAGAPLQLDFGEQLHEPSVVVVDAEAGTPARVDTVPLLGGRRLATVAGTLDELDARRSDHPPDRPEWLRLVLTPPVASDAGRLVREWFPNAVDVVLPTTRPTVSRAYVDPSQAPDRLLADYLQEIGTDDARLVALFNELLATEPDDET